MRKLLNINKENIYNNNYKIVTYTRTSKCPIGNIFFLNGLFFNHFTYRYFLRDIDFVNYSFQFIDYPFQGDSIIALRKDINVIDQIISIINNWVEINKSTNIKNILVSHSIGSLFADKVIGEFFFDKVFYINPFFLQIDSMFFFKNKKSFYLDFLKIYMEVIIIIN